MNPRSLRTTGKPASVTGSHSVLPTLVALFLSGLLSSLAFQTILSTTGYATVLMSEPTWRGLMGMLDAPVSRIAEEWTAEVPFLPIAFGTALLYGTLLAIGVRRRGGSARTTSNRQKTGLRVAGWLGIMGGWEILRIFVIPLEWPILSRLLIAPLPCYLAIAVAGAIAAAFDRAETTSSIPSVDNTDRSVPWTVWLGIGIYVLVFTAMNWGLYANLRIPHGDSAMYEEHLWNVWHGKGFRSYLDQGLFLGEHIQVIHLFLLPVHLLWPSLLSMEFCESLALGVGAVPVYWMARRHGGGQTPAVLLSLAYLLYVPLQFLDIAIDLKTFRPISFGVPLLLFAIDQMERRNWKTATVLLLFCLSAKEDFALVMAPLGLWFAVDGWWRGRGKSDGVVSRPAIRFGVLLCIMSTLYLVFATRLAIPYFRGWEEVHYARYFSRFGDTLPEIAFTILLRPDRLFAALATVPFLLTLLMLLTPIAGLPLRSPTRFLVGVPLLVLLGLNELASDPRHHFHAPLVPIVFWAAAAGLRIGETSENATRRARFAFVTAFVTGTLFSLSPLGVTFWDSGSAWHWRTLYLPDARAKAFDAVAEQIPRTARVASTDFAHTRFTHYERSYDYSDYVRAVAGNTTSVPDDTEYIVFDLKHPYSTVRSRADVRELRETPDEWAVLPDRTNGYFLILKRNESGEGTGSEVGS